MANEVRASFRGMAQYVDLCRDQQQYVQTIEDLASGSCANVGAFSGFMVFFADAYREAQATAADEIRAAARAAGQLGTNIADTRADLRSTDEGVTKVLEGLRVSVQCAEAPGIGGAGGDGPGMPAPIKTANAGFGVLAEAEGMAGDLRST